MATNVALETLSATLRKQVTAVRGTITKLAKDYGVIREKVAEVAPRVIKLFKAIQNEQNGVTMADFARIFDPSVPTHAADDKKTGAKGYRSNRTFQAISYMQQIVQRAERGPSQGRQGKRDPATDQLARMISTILQVIRPADHGVVWQAVKDEFRFGDKALAGLTKRVEAADPLIDLKAAVKPVSVAPSNIHHMPRLVPAPSPAEALAGAARAVGVRGRGRRRRVSEEELAATA